MMSRPPSGRGSNQRGRDKTAQIAICGCTLVGGAARSQSVAHGLLVLRLFISFRRLLSTKHLLGRNMDVGRSVQASPGSKITDLLHTRVAVAGLEVPVSSEVSPSPTRHHPLHQGSSSQGKRDVVALPHADDLFEATQAILSTWHRPQQHGRLLA
ncbi:hypothetical protein OH77DRAFT_1003414 [Trametes cingulata]|nr:hypothetical protein OH77DRAFT_1003414 [Trametes cingulata]